MIKNMITLGTGGALGKIQNQMPKTTNAEANRKIKQIASRTGINTPATENGVTAPKWTFVRTHTARRSAATNLAMGGATTDFICKLGGWKKLETLEKYLLATRMEVARISGVACNFFSLDFNNNQNIITLPYVFQTEK